jgi:uncharacterized protein YndB with AHSA1/START domain
VLSVAILTALAFARVASADTGRALRVETTVKGPVAAVWEAWTTSAGAQTFFATKANIELQLGAPYEIFFNPADERMSTKGRKVLSYEPPRMLSFEWNLPLDEFPQLQGERTWVVVELQPADASHTHVTITQLGLKEGPVWDRAYTHMERGWKELTARLKQRFDSGPIDWNSQVMMWQERAAN